MFEEWNVLNLCMICTWTFIQRLLEIRSDQQILMHSSNTKVDVVTLKGEEVTTQQIWQNRHSTTTNYSCNLIPLLLSVLWPWWLPGKKTSFWKNPKDSALRQAQRNHE